MVADRRRLFAEPSGSEPDGATALHLLYQRLRSFGQGSARECARRRRSKDARPHRRRRGTGIRADRASRARAFP